MDEAPHRCRYLQMSHCHVALNLKPNHCHHLTPLFFARFPALQAWLVIHELSEPRSLVAGEIALTE